MNRMMIRVFECIAAWCLWWVVVSPASAQDPEAEKGRHVRFIALGDMPPFRQVVRDGVRYELPPPPGSVPPAELLVSTIKGGTSPDAPKPAGLRLQLDRLTKPIPVQNGTGTLQLTAASAKGEPWLRAAQPEAGDFLVVIWRDPESQTWDKVKALVLPDKPAAGKFTVLNVAQSALGVVYGNEKLVVVPGKPLERDLAAGKGHEFHVGIPKGDGSIKRIVSMSLEQQPAEHSLVLICRSDGVAPRQPVKLTVVKSQVRPLAP